MATAENARLSLLHRYGIDFPPRLAEIFDDLVPRLRPVRREDGVLVYEKVEPKVTRAVLQAPRGGGKTKLLATVGYAHLRFLRHDVIILGGSMTQSTQGYTYLGEILDDDDELLPRIVKRTQRYTSYWDGTGPLPRERRATATDAARARFGDDVGIDEPTAGEIWVRCLPASEKQVRSPHAGDLERGGTLLLDEEAEVREEIVKAALPTVNTAHPPVIVRSSTFHQAAGTFADAVDEAGTMGYRVYQWDLFDVATTCPYAKGRKANCAKRCPLPDPFVRRTIEDGTVVEGYCAGKAISNPRGWVSIDAIAQGWRENDVETFEVEWMGWRKTSKGFVYRREHIDRSFRDAIAYRGEETWLGIDWSYAFTAVLFYQWGEEEVDGVPTIEVYDAWKFELIDPEAILDQIDAERKDRKILRIYADAAFAMENAALRKRRYRVRPIQFSEVKERWSKPQSRNLLEKDRLRFSRSIAPWLREQLSGLRESPETGRIIKGNDDGPDANFCGILHAVGVKPMSGVGAAATAFRRSGSGEHSGGTSVSGAKAKRDGGRGDDEKTKRESTDAARPGKARPTRPISPPPPSPPDERVLDSDAPASDLPDDRPLPGSTAAVFAPREPGEASVAASTQDDSVALRRVARRRLDSDPESGSGVQTYTTFLRALAKRGVRMRFGDPQELRFRAYAEKNGGRADRLESGWLSVWRAHTEAG